MIITQVEEGEIDYRRSSFRGCVVMEIRKQREERILAQRARDEM